MTDHTRAPSVTLRPVVMPDDQAFLWRVYESTRADELALVPWSEEEKIAFLDMQFRAQHTDYQTRFPDSEHSIVLADGEAVGRIWIDRREDEIRLIDIALLSARRGEGVGSILLLRLQREAVEAGKPLRHSVHADNTEAVRLYEGLGFVAVEDFGIHVLMEWIPGG